MKRRTLTVCWNKPADGMPGFWSVEENSFLVDDFHFPNKAWAIGRGAALCREIKLAGGRARLIVKNRNGRIAKGGHGERTYGADPRRTRG